MLQLDSDANEEDKAFFTVTNTTPQLPVSMSHAVNTALECHMITWESLLGKKRKVNLVADNVKASHLTRSRKVYQPRVQGEVSKENPRPQVAGTELMDALNIAVDYGNTQIPKVLIENGSSVNVCPSTTLAKLGISPIDLAPCAQTIRAYDNISRNVLGIVSFSLTLGAVSMKVYFYVMDIMATFNLLLGRPWIHEVKKVLSTLHQMIKFLLGNCIVTVMAEKYVGKGKESEVPLIEIQHEGAEDLFLSGFHIEPQTQVLNIVYIKETDFIGGRWTEYGEMITLNMLKKMNFFPDFGLGRSNQRIHEFPELQGKIGYPFGLGYAHMSADVVEHI